MRFAMEDSHQIFIEPEGLSAVEVYPNGISTSLPFDVQWGWCVRCAASSARITRPGYAIEYDFFDPRDLQPTSRANTSTGCSSPARSTARPAARGRRLGLLAGTNAALQVRQGRGRRRVTYLGVLVDDLITRGTQEPYRMFTSRAEYRLMLREDNADLRLTDKGRELAFVGNAQWAFFERKREAIAREQQRRDTLVRPGQLDEGRCRELFGDVLQETRALDLVTRPRWSPRSRRLPTSARPRSMPTLPAGSSSRSNPGNTPATSSASVTRSSVPAAPRRSACPAISTMPTSRACHPRSAARASPPGDHRPGRALTVTPAAVSLLLIHLKRKSA